jgi:hypothetical protein
VTERIAALVRGTGIKQTKRRVRVRAGQNELSGSRATTQENKTNWERQFFYLLTRALMGDPFTDWKLRAGLRQGILAVAKAARCFRTGNEHPQSGL